MSDISKISFGNVTYTVKDSGARNLIANLQGVVDAKVAVAVYHAADGQEADDWGEDNYDNYHGGYLLIGEKDWQQIIYTGGAWRRGPIGITPAMLIAPKNTGVSVEDAEDFIVQFSISGEGHTRIEELFAEDHNIKRIAAWEWEADFFEWLPWAKSQGHVKEDDLVVKMGAELEHGRSATLYKANDTSHSAKQQTFRKDVLYVMPSDKETPYSSSTSFGFYMYDGACLVKIADAADLVQSRLQAIQTAAAYTDTKVAENDRFVKVKLKSDTEANALNIINNLYPSYFEVGDLVEIGGVDIISSVKKIVEGENDQKALQACGLSEEKIYVVPANINQSGSQIGRGPYNLFVHSFTGDPYWYRLMVYPEVHTLATNQAKSAVANRVQHIHKKVMNDSTTILDGTFHGDLILIPNPQGNGYAQLYRNNNGILDSVTPSAERIYMAPVAYDVKISDENATNEYEYYVTKSVQGTLRLVKLVDEMTQPPYVRVNRNCVFATTAAMQSAVSSIPDGYYLWDREDSTLYKSLGGTAVAVGVTEALVVYLPVSNNEHTTYDVLLYTLDVGNRQWLAKESGAKLPVVAATGESLTAMVDRYYRFDAEVNTLAITLPAMSTVDSVRGLIVGFMTGNAPAVTIASADGKDIKYYDGYGIGVYTRYELNFMYNGSYWTVAYGTIV